MNIDTDKNRITRILGDLFGKFTIDGVQIEAF